MEPSSLYQVVKWHLVEPDYFICYDHLIILMNFWLSTIVLIADKVPDMLIVEWRHLFVTQEKTYVIISDT